MTSMIIFLMLLLVLLLLRVMLDRWKPWASSVLHILNLLTQYYYYHRQVIIRTIHRRVVGVLINTIYRYKAPVNWMFFHQSSTPLRPPRTEELFARERTCIQIDSTPHHEGNNGIIKQQIRSRRHYPSNQPWVITQYNLFPPTGIADRVPYLPVARWLVGRWPT